ncbi:MAG: RICIN domain-containing protein [Lachnospiraceae bacterium]|nr:RICIN domain-containing protein [Lachnospiraceae bacterium]
MRKKLITILAVFAIVFSMALPALPVIPAQQVYADEAAAGSDEETVQYLIPLNAPDSAVEVTGSGKLQLWARDPERAQGWIMHEEGEYVYFEEAEGGRVIEVPGGKVQNGVQLSVADYDGSDKQLWKMKENADGSYSIKSKLNDGFVMDNYGATNKNGSQINIHENNDGTNQHFTLMSEEEIKAASTALLGYGEDEGYAIVPVHAGSTAVDLGMDSGGVQLYKAHRKKNQLWTIKKHGDYYSFESMASGNRAIAVDGNKAQSGVKLMTTESYSGSDMQLFKLEPAGDGTYYIRSKANEKMVWDVEGLSTSNGARIMVHELNRGPNQRFRFVHVTTVEPMSDWGASRNDCYASDFDVWDGGADTSWYYQDTSAATYTIDSARALAGLSKLVREGTQDFYGRTILLTRDISLGGTEWRRIGYKERPFKGSFNGMGHAITGLSITTTASQDGFFGQVEGGVITNFAIKGSVSGDWNTGGVVGNMAQGQLVNVYSEVTLTRATDDNEGGICGRLGTNAYVEHCTQNARVNSGDKDPDRGGIAGYQCGVIRYCENLSSVECNWDCVGGISGECVGGKIEYCRNAGQVSGGGDTQWAGGMCGKAREDAMVFACYNSGTIFSDDDDDIGGICGERFDTSRVVCCINTGRVYGDDRIGGIVGYGICGYSFNAGYVSGDDDVGAISGKTEGHLAWCRALSWTSARCLGSDSDGHGAEWVSAGQVISGQACYDLNRGELAPDLGTYGPDWTEIFYQNINGDPIPTFTGQKVIKSGSSFVNEKKEVKVEYKKGYGTVSGGGLYDSGKVVLKATAADGCLFDHFEVTTSKQENRSMYSGGHPYPTSETKTYKDEEIVLSEDIQTSYTVKAVFGVYDEVPADLRQSVKVELECTDDAGGWNSSTIPVYLIDSAGERHLWEVSRTSLDDDGEKVTHTFDLGGASPVGIEAWPDFGGGITFRDYQLKARMWVNNTGKAIESEKVTIRSWPFISSKYGQDFMDIAFGNVGNSSVGVYKADGSLDVKGTYDTCTAAWDAAKKLGNNAVVRLDGVWLTNSRLTLGDKKTITLDLNGYPIIRSIKKTAKNGEVVEIESGATLNVVDSGATKKSCSAFYGGSIQGGRSTNSGGVFEVAGTLNMTGGAIYNGGTTDVGGGIRCKGGTVNLTKTLIASCWSAQARIYDNDGGGIAVRDGGKVTMNGCTIRACNAQEKGGAIHLNDSKSRVNLYDTKVAGCRARDDEGGAIYQDDGELYCENVVFDCNRADEKGGALYKNTDDQVWFVGCTFKGNQADSDDGGAIYLDDNYLYMRDCTLTGNAASDKGGAIYLSDDGSIDMGGVMVIKGNDASGTWDNLVLEKGANFYDLGLEPGSEVHLRSEKSGEVKMASDDFEISEYQVKNFLVSDYEGGLGLSDTKTVNTRLMASAFSPGRIALIIGGIVIILAGVVMYRVYSRRKGDAA